MLLIGLTSLLMAIPLYSSTITPTLLTRVTSITLLFSAFISFNGLYVQAIGSGLGLYSGLFHVTSVTQAMEVFLFTVGAFILLPWASILPSGSQVVVNTSDTIEKPSCEVPSQNHSNLVMEKEYSEKVVNTEASSRLNVQVPTIAEYPLIIIFTTIGASFLISSSDLVSMYLSIELQSFAVYILAAIYRNSESATSASLKYFLLGALSSALILLGSSIIYAYTGLTSFEGINMLTSEGGSISLSPLGGPSAYNLRYENAVVLGVLIIGVGFLFKVAAAPFHNWAPDVYDGVPTIVTTWLTVMPKISIFIFLLELQIGSDVYLALSDLHVINISPNTQLLGTENVWKNLLLTTSLLSLIIGTVVGLAQYRLKRLLAFSTISHVGFLLLALSVNSEESVTSFIFYLMQYSITNLNAFFVILAFGYVMADSKESLSDNDQMLSKIRAITNRTQDITFITELKGQFNLNPLLGLSLAICLFSMAGIPPLVGFFAKYMVLYSAIENGYYFLALVGILASVVSAAYYLRIIRVVFFSSDQLFVISKADNNMSPHNLSESLIVNPQNLPSRLQVAITSTHGYTIAVLTLLIALYIISPSLFLNSSSLLALSLFTA